MSSKPKSRRSSKEKVPPGDYDGEVNATGKRDGQGRCRFSDGTEYDGEWKDGKMHGKGRYKLADGDVFEGTWLRGVKQGPGTMWYASGRADVVCFDKDADESEGARWSVDRAMAWRLHRGEVIDEITPEEAQRIAERLGEPVPPRIIGDSPWRSGGMAAATGAS